MATEVWDNGPGAEEGGTPELYLITDTTTVEAATQELLAYCKKHGMQATLHDDGSVYVSDPEECWDAIVQPEDFQRAVARPNLRIQLD